MSAVTILLIVLIGAINGLSWVVLDSQSDSVLHTLANVDDRFMQMEFYDRHSIIPPLDIDTIKSARFFTVHIDQHGNVLDVNVDQISSVTVSEAIQYTKQITDISGKIDGYKYEVKQLGADYLIFFMDTTNQLNTFLMVLSLSSIIALICWLIILLFVVLLSGKVVRPIIANMEKQKQFITNAGHELKTPLAIIQSNNDASTLLHGETKYSKNIRFQTQRLNILMTNLLTLAKLDEDVKLPSKTVNISQLICGMFPAYEASASSKQITLSVNIQPDIFMQIHQETFVQMISILLDNAVKYTPDSGKIWFSVVKEAGHILISEENTCEKLNNSDPERLFERFYRGDSARTQSSTASGYGIGLSAARAIAETFGGKLTANLPEAGKIKFTACF